MKLNAVFEGGGVKGIALAGAVEEAESRGITFCHVAGTSSGAIVASMLAAGYRGRELKEIIEQTPFSSFVQETWLHKIPWLGAPLRLMVKKGMYAGTALEQWIADLLAEKGVFTFGDLKPGQLRIIASDISRSRLLVLPEDLRSYGIDPNRFPVAKAVRMSASLPFFFDPVIIRKRPDKPAGKLPFRYETSYVVDGGILSNFPMWLFDKAREQPDGCRVPTIGMQLVGSNERMPNPIHGPITMLQALFATMMDAHDQRYIEEHNRFRTIKIPTLGVSTTEFSITPEKSRQLYESGRKAAKQFFDRWSLAAYVKMYEQHVGKTWKV